MAQILGTNPSFRGKDDRSHAWTITCDLWDAQGISPLILPINPESMEIRFPISGADVTMYGGKVVPTKRNPRTGSVFDYPTLAVKFNSGNIQPMWSEAIAARTSETNLAAAYLAAGAAPLDSTTTKSTWSESSINQVRNAKPNADAPRGLLPSPLPTASETDNVYGAFSRTNVKAHGKNAVSGLYAGNKEIPVGVQNLYALLAMVNGPWMMSSNENSVTGNRRFSVMNRIKLSTSTLAFPSLVFYGYAAEDGLQWSETADNFNNFDLSFTLVVTNTFPHLHSMVLRDMFTVYKTKIFAPTSVFDSDPATIKIDTLGPGDGGTCPDTGDGKTKTEDPAKKEGEPSLLDRINSATDAVNKFDEKYFGNPNVENRTGGPQDASAGLLRNSLAAGIDAGSSDIDYYAQAVIDKVDPAFADLQRQQLLTTGRGIQNSSELASAQMAAQNANDTRVFYSELNRLSAATLAANGVLPQQSPVAVKGAGGAGASNG